MGAYAGIFGEADGPLSGFFGVCGLVELFKQVEAQGPVGLVVGDGLAWQAV